MNQNDTITPASVLTATLGDAAMLRPAQAMAKNLRGGLISHPYLECVAVELERMDALINSPELIDFPKAVQLEAAHQRERFGTEHEGGKTPEDWYWLIGHLAGRAQGHHKEAERLAAQLKAGYAVSLVDGTLITKSIEHHREKAVHHCITTAAACANWHAAVLGLTNMRPGYDLPEAVQPSAAETNPLENAP